MAGCELDLDGFTRFSEHDPKDNGETGLYILANNGVQSAAILSKNIKGEYVWVRMVFDFNTYTHWKKIMVKN